MRKLVSSASACFKSISVIHREQQRSSQACVAIMLFRVCILNFKCDSLIDFVFFRMLVCYCCLVLVWVFSSRLVFMIELLPFLKEKKNVALPEKPLSSCWSPWPQSCIDICFARLQYCRQQRQSRMIQRTNGGVRWRLCVAAAASASRTHCTNPADPCRCVGLESDQALRKQPCHQVSSRPASLRDSTNPQLPLWPLWCHF